MIAPSTLDAVIAEAYSRLALSRSDMRRATDLIERARSTAIGSKDAVEATEAFGELIAATATSESLCKVIGDIRDAVIAARVEMELVHFRETACKDAQSCQRAWQQAIAKAIGGFHLDLADHYLSADIGVEPPDRQEMKRGVTAARQGLWRECPFLYERLGTDPSVAAPLRGRILAILAEIHAIVLSDHATATKHLAQAEELDAKEWRIAFCRGRMFGEGAYKATGNTAAAEAFARANSLAEGRVAAPLVSLGDLEKAKGNLVAAERYYLQACTCAVIPAEGYSALIALAGYPSLFADRRAQIEDLVRRASLVADNKTDTYDAMLAAAEAARGNGEIKGFYSYIEQAITFDPSRIQAYLNRGYARLDLNELDAANGDFDQVIALAPVAPDGWWGRARLAEERKDWHVLRDSAAEALRRAPDWSESITALLENAASELTSADPALARTMYETLRAVLGDRYEASFQNRLGNLNFFHSQYDDAVSCYRLSLKAEPSSTRYEANLALGLEMAAQADPEADYAEAYTLASNASDRDPNPEFIELRERLMYRRCFVPRFGSAARILEQYSPRLRVLLDPPMLERFVEGKQLRSWIVARMAALRSEIEETHGFTLPGIRFSHWTLAETSASIGLEIQGELVWIDRFVTTPEDVFGPLADAIRGRLALVFGHEDAQEVARHCSQGEERLDPVRLNAIAVTGRALLARGKRLECSDLPAPAAAPNLTPPPESGTYAAPAVVLILRHGTAAFDKEFPRWMQEFVFSRTGVMIPLVIPEFDATLPPGTATLALNGEKLISSNNATGKAIAEAVMEHASSLLDPVAVGHHLLVLEETQPILVKVVRAVLGLSALTEKSRAWLAQGKSIRNLPRVVETLVFAEAPISTTLGAKVAKAP